MIQDGETARQAVELTQHANKLLTDSLELVRSKCSDEEYKAYSRAMAQVTGHLFFLVMEPIYCWHPSLAPPDTPPDFLERWRRMGQQQNIE
jgi:hypothetical protein